MLHELIEAGREAQRTGAWDQAVAHYQGALATLPPGDARLTADVLRQLGTVHRERGELDRALECYQSARETAEAAGLTDAVAAALNCIAAVALLRGQLDDAAEHFRQARAVAERAGDERVLAMVEQNLGTIANIQGDVEAALLAYRSALVHYHRLGDHVNATRALNNMGMAHVDLCEWDDAALCFDDAAGLCAVTGDRLLEGRVELNRTELHLRRSQWTAARESLSRSLLIFHRLRTRPQIAEAYRYHGVLYRETGQPEQADAHFALAVGLAESCQNPLLQAEAQMEWALLHMEEGRGRQGVLCLNRALAIFRDLKARREVLDVERRLERLQKVYLPAVQGWSAELAEGGDPFQAGHARRVADYASKLARELGVSGSGLLWLRVGALIHDLGNAAIPSGVLAKADELSADERDLMRAHTVVGEAMAAQFHFPDEVRPIVRSHHEQWAGAGYPDGLREEEIPLGARIVGVADVFDALTSPRSFRAAFSRQEALRIMEREAERMFDPSVFGVFRDMLLRGALTTV